MKKILVTGGCGYIGSHTVLDLLENGFEVVIADNFSNSYPEIHGLLEEISKARIKLYKGDLCNQQFTSKIFEENKDLTGIIHFAASKYVNESVEKPLEYYNNNLNSLMNVLENCKKHSITNFVFSSSCSVYGNATELPVSETTPMAVPESPYADTKVIGENIIRSFTSANNFQATLLRYFNPAGAHISGKLGEKPRVEPMNIVPRITGTALGKFKEFKIAGTDYPTKDGTCIRDYIHVSDIAHAHTLAIEWLTNQTKPTCEIFNLGTGDGVSVLELVKAFEKATGKKLNYSFAERRVGDVIAVYANNSKAKEVLGWSLKYTLEDMMKTSWEWDCKS